jgi:hypothetical protein
MSDAKAYPYETRLNIYYQPLEIVDEKALADACTFPWYNQTLCQVNGSGSFSWGISLAQARRG